MSKAKTVSKKPTTQNGIKLESILDVITNLGFIPTGAQFFGYNLTDVFDDNLNDVNYFGPNEHQDILTRLGFKQIVWNIYQFQDVTVRLVDDIEFTNRVQTFVYVRCYDEDLQSIQQMFKDLEEIFNATDLNLPYYSNDDKNPVKIIKAAKTESKGNLSFSDIDEEEL